MTHAILARDSATADLGAAVASRYFAVGASVPWARAAVGVVASQALTRPSYGLRTGTGCIPYSGTYWAPLDLAEQQSAARFLLVHGRDDSINSIGESGNLHRKLVRAGTDSEFVPVDTDHAGVIFTRFDERLGICVPEPSPRVSSLKVVAAVRAFVF